MSIHRQEMREKKKSIQKCCKNHQKDRFIQGNLKKEEEEETRTVCLLITMD